MDSSLIKAVLPKTPLMAKVALSHSLGISEHSRHWSLRTELIITVLRDFLISSKPGPPLSKLQHMSLKDPGIKGRIWVSKVTVPVLDEVDIGQKLISIIDSLDESGWACKLPDTLPVEAEWTGYRSRASKHSELPEASEDERYHELMKEVSSPATVLYFHGGAHYLMDPASHRPFLEKLAKLTKGRYFNVRYRLSPQNPFPAALLDALVAYFYLLYPPASALHSPVDPCHIVFSGDSAGGNICLALLQTVLELRRQGLKVIWNGKEREVPLPAGVALNSAWADVTQSSPSCETNKNYDYLPASSVYPEGHLFEPCPIWPANPPRWIPYCEDAMLCHPLVSPLIAKSWAGSCPMWIETGQELLSDEDKHLATKAALQGVTVIYEEYETMPHCFAMMLPIPESKRCFKGWSNFITAVVERPDTLATGGTRIMAGTLREVALQVGKLSTYTDDEVLTRMRSRAEKMTRKAQELARL